MYSRRIQKVGKSTLMISIPHEWRERLSIRAGDTVSLEEEDGIMRIFASKNPQYSEMTCNLNSDKCLSPELLQQAIIGLYVTGKNVIDIMSNSKITSSQMDEIRLAVAKLTGVNIVEERNGLVKLRCFVAPSRYPVQALLKRIYVISSGMLNYVAQMLSTGEPLSQRVSNMEDEIDKLYLLIMRQILWAARFPQDRKDLGYNSILHVVGDRTIADSLENIGDRLHEMSVLAQGDVWQEIDPADKRQFLQLKEQIQILYDHAMQAIFTLETVSANEAVKLSENVVRDIYGFIERSFMHSPQRACALSNRNLREMARKMIDIANYCRTISHIALNRIMEDENAVCCWKKEELIAQALASTMNSQ